MQRRIGLLDQQLYSAHTDHPELVLAKSSHQSPQAGSMDQSSSMNGLENMRQATSTSRKNTGAELRQARHQPQTCFARHARYSGPFKRCLLALNFKWIALHRGCTRASCHEATPTTPHDALRPTRIMPRDADFALLLSRQHAEPAAPDSGVELRAVGAVRLEVEDCGAGVV